MAMYLVDTSVFARRSARPEVRDVLAPLLIWGHVATCGVIDLELLYSATNARNHARVAAGLRLLPRVEITEAVVNRALDVQARLVERSQHRGVRMPDLLIAACAESADLTVMHYDADYERIAEVTGQPLQWVVPRGSVA
jgi:predicted nucleic acid-binding protein